MSTLTDSAIDIVHGAVTDSVNDPMTTPVVAPVNATAELDRLGDEIAALSAHLDAATARLLDLIREFDSRGGWGNGFRSCAHWLSWRVGLDLGAAREKVRVARALGTLPRLAKALARGELSYAKIRALTRVATPATEERLLAVGRAGTAEHVERIVRGWRRVDRNAEAQEAAQRRKCRALRVYRDCDGMVAVHGRLEPEVGELLLQALTAARERLYQQRPRTFDEPGPRDLANEPPTLEQQQADALALLAETALHHGVDPGPPGERADLRVRELAPGEGLRQPRQSAERPRDADLLARRAEVEPDAPTQPVRARAEPVAPAAAGVKVADEIEQSSRRRIEMHRELGDLVAEALEPGIIAGAWDHVGAESIHGIASCYRRL
jgi:hypothetical protein